MTGSEFLQAGSFNLRLTLQIPVTENDGCGGTTRQWQPAFDIWVRLVPVKGILVERARSEAMETTHWIFMRRRPDVTKEMRFVSGTGEHQRIFEIDTLRDPDETGRYLVCEVTEIE